VSVEQASAFYRFLPLVSGSRRRLAAEFRFPIDFDEFAVDSRWRWGTPLRGSEVVDVSTRFRAVSIASILVRDLYEGGAPREPSYRAWEFGGVAIELELSPSESSVDYVLRRTIRDQAPDELALRLAVSSTALHFGGRRMWLHCMRPSCGARNTELFLDAPNLICRACAGVRYASHSQPKHIRLRVKADKIRTRLGGEPGHYSAVAAKPKNMQWKTYDRLRCELEYYEEEFGLHAVAAFTARTNRELGSVFESADVPEAVPSVSLELARALEGLRKRRPD
jgi:hypothetical protein